ncbi:MAG: EAL domain-containing protein [Saccharospirillum sp.]|nr:EAL domain-containing protein [Saccharospirillum sp.]
MTLRFLSVLLLSLSLGSKTLGLELTDQLRQQPLTEHAFYWEDPSAQLSWPEALEAFERGEYRATEGTPPNLGYSRSALWIAIPITTQTSPEGATTFDGLIQLNNPAMDWVELWVLEQGQPTHTFKDGDLEPEPTINERLFSPRFPIEFQLDGRDYLLLVRVHGEGSIQAPLTLWQRTEYFTNLPLSNFYWGLFYGVLLFALAFNLLLALSTRRNAYWPYIGFVLGVTAATALLNGHFRYLFGQSVSHQLAPFAPHFGFFALFALVMFTQQVLQTRDNLKRSHRILQATVWVNVAVLLASPWLSYRILSLLILVDLIWLLTISLTTAALLVRQQRRVALFYLTSWAPFLLALILYMGRNVGWLPVNFLTQLALPVGLMFSVVLLSLVLADSLKQAELAALNAAQRERSALKALTRNQRETARRALTDPVSGLPNKAQLARWFEQNMTGESAPAIVLIVRPINLRALLNTLGEANVDRLNQTAAQRLVAMNLPALKAVNLSNDDESPSYLAQVEARNFLIVLQPAPDTPHLRLWAERIYQTLAAPMQLPELEIDLIYTLGAARFPEDGITLPTLVRKAQVAVDHARRLSTHFAFYTAAEDPYRPERLQLASQLRRAIDHNELRLYFQPQLNLRTGKVTGVEALARWPRAEGDWVPPDRFIGIAESTGLINDLTDWVLMQALEALEDCLSKGHRICMSVNLSATDLLRADLAERIAHQVAIRGLPTELLAFEITESTLIQDWARTTQTLNQLRESGFAISLDDFGTGYSSLAYLDSLPIDCLKIDQRFVSPLDHPDWSASMVQTIIQLAANLGIKTLAEGVETEVASLRLAELGCESIQGYWLARPMPLEELDEWCRCYAEGNSENEAAFGRGRQKR